MKKMKIHEIDFLVRSELLIPSMKFELYFFDEPNSFFHYFSIVEKETREQVLIIADFRIINTNEENSLKNKIIREVMRRKETEYFLDEYFYNEKRKAFEIELTKKENKKGVNKI